MPNKGSLLDAQRLLFCLCGDGSMSVTSAVKSPSSGPTEGNYSLTPQQIARQTDILTD